MSHLPYWSPRMGKDQGAGYLFISHFGRQRVKVKLLKIWAIFVIFFNSMCWNAFLVFRNLLNCFFFLEHPHYWHVNHSLFKKARGWGSGNKKKLRSRLLRQKYSHNLVHINRIMYKQRQYKILKVQVKNKIVGTFLFYAIGNNVRHHESFFAKYFDFFGIIMNTWTCVLFSCQWVSWKIIVMCWI